MTDQATPPNSIDVTSVAEALKTTFAAWGTEYVYSSATASPGLAWLAWPLVSSVFRMVISLIITTLINSAIMEVFFLNTAIKKASQAQDFISALSEKNALSPNATDEEFENAEKKQMAAFHSLVMLAS